MDLLVSHDWLAARFEEPRLRIVDGRFRFGEPAAGRRWSHRVARGLPVEIGNAWADEAAG